MSYNYNNNQQSRYIKEYKQNALYSPTLILIDRIVIFAVTYRVRLDRPPSQLAEHGPKSDQADQVTQEGLLQSTTSDAGPRQVELPKLVDTHSRVRI